MFRILSLFVLGAFLSAYAIAGQIVVNFDDLRGQADVPDGYGGVANWGWWQYYDWSQPPYNPSSPPTRVYNYRDGVFSFGRDVVFIGAFFNGYGTRHGFRPISFQLFDDGNLVWTSGSIDLPGDGNGQFLDAGYRGRIDTVKVVGSYGYFIMDDMTYVPEPTTMAVLGVGLAGLALFRSKR